MDSTDVLTQSEHGDVDSGDETLNSNNEQQDAEAKGDEANEDGDNVSINDDNEVPESPNEYNPDLKDLSQDNTNMDSSRNLGPSFDNSPHSIDSQVLAIQQNLGKGKQ